MPHVGDAQRPIGGFAGEEDGARAAGEHGPLVLDGELLVNERANEPARLFRVRAAEKMAPLRPRKDADMQGYQRDPFGLSAAPAEGRELAGAVLQRRDRDGARCLRGGARRHPVTSARSPRTYVMRRPIGFTIISSGSTVSKNVNRSDSVQRSRLTSAPPPVRVLMVGSPKIVAASSPSSPCNGTPTTVAVRVVREQGGPATPCAKKRSMKVVYVKLCKIRVMAEALVVQAADCSRSFFCSFRNSMLR